MAGMGGGFDVFCGLPIFLELEQLGYNVHLASLSFSDIAGLNDGEQLTDTLVGVTGDIEGIFDYFPEYYLAQWFYDERNEEVTIWCFEKTGARPLIKNYQTLVKHLGIDAIILVDGGVDSLMQGNEPEPGTLFEDSLSLLAVNELKTVRNRFTVCLGLGAEAEVGYAHLFENIATLTKMGAFRGSCALTREMQCYKHYEEAVMYVFDQQPAYSSVINASVISAVRGEYGNYHLTKRTQGNRLYISPLMSIYWFFDLPRVAQQNLLLPHLRLTHDVEEAWKIMQDARSKLTSRLAAEYPLP
jgi:hypothetical protein